MYTNYPMGGYQQPYGQNMYAQNMGMQYVTRAQAKNTQPLSQEVINKLRASSNIDWTVSQEDLWRAQCTHKDHNGMSTLTMDNEGNCHCNICGADFKFFDGDMATVKSVVDAMDNILQTTKTIFLDIPENFAQAYFQYMPLMKKLPQLWGQATKNFNQYDQPVGMIPTNGYTTNNWGLVGTLTGNPAYGQYMPQPPMMGQQMPMGGMPMQTQMMPQQPMMGQQMPMSQPIGMMGQPVQNNPFATAPASMPNIPQPQAPVMNQQMQQSVPQPNAQPQNVQPQQAPQPAPQNPAPAPSNNGEVVQQQTFSV